MRTSTACLSALLLLSCGSDESPGGRSPGDAASSAGGRDGRGGGTGAGGRVAPPPPVPDTCEAPARAADVSSPTTVVSPCTEAALDAALAAGGIVTFDCGGEATLELSAGKTIRVDTVIDGGGTVTLSGGGAHRLFAVEDDASLTVQRITLADARVDGPRGDGPSADNSGAAIYRGGTGTLTVVDSTFRNNHATPAGADVGGGAIFSRGGDTVIVGSTFDGNSAASGGAVGNLRSNLTIVNSTFVNNRALAHGGGAIALDGLNPDHGKVFTLCGVVARNNRARVEGGAVYRYGYPGESSVIDSTTLDGNTAEDPDGAHAGGMYHHTDSPGEMPLTLTNSTISNNTSGRGAGALFFYGSPVTLVNVTIAGNTAETSLAGAIAANGVTGTLQNCTIAGNHADHASSFAGAIIGGDGLTLQNTLIAGNTAGNEWNPVSCTETAAAGANNLQHPAEQESGQPDRPCAPGVQFADPLLGPLQDNGGPTWTLALASGSPAIGAGTDCPPTDQRGVARASDRCDVGAYQTEP